MKTQQQSDAAQTQIAATMTQPESLPETPLSREERAILARFARRANILAAMLIASRTTRAFAGGTFALL
jgi:hypothetical protein